MDDIHQQVGIRLWHRISEEISTHYRELTWGGGDFSDYVRLIEQNPLCFGRARENGAEQVAASAADVRDSCKLREIVSWHDGCDIAVRFRSHRRIEDAALFRVLGEVRENAAGVSLCEGGFAVRNECSRSSKALQKTGKPSMRT